MTTTTTLIDILQNHIILRQTATYLPIRSTLNLAATNHALRDLLLLTPETFSHLDLRPVAAAVLPDALSEGPLDRGGQSFRAERMDESLTEDEFYGGPLRGIFARLHRLRALECVSTLVLDGLTVPADMVAELLADPEGRFASLRVLSIRRCLHLNERKLCQALRYAVRPGRPEGTPRIRGLYVFGPGDAEVARLEDVQASIAEGEQRSLGVTNAEGAQIGAMTAEDTVDKVDRSIDPWYRRGGEVMKAPMLEWAETLEACKGIIFFDAILCRGPRHDFLQSGKDWLGPSVAHLSLGGCATCGSCPEGPAVYGQHESTAFPLLAPPPLHSTTVKAAQQPFTGRGDPKDPSHHTLILRCQECVRNRRCQRCNKWWCEACYQAPIGTNAQGLPGSTGTDTQVKVYFDVCVENCLRSEMMQVTDGMWG